jgi:outer membrane protein TolC
VDAAELTAFTKEISDAFDSWKNDWERYEALSRALEAAQKNFTLQKDEYQKRLVSNLDVLDAMQSLFETKRDANEAFYTMKKRYWQLEVAKGNCCSVE